MPIRFHIPALTLALCTLAGCHGDVGPTDGDGDGFISQIDCDDTDANVHPFATEVPGDGLDNDCDLATDCDDPDLTAPWTGDLGEADLPDFCSGYCARSVTGSILLDDTSLTDLDALTCLTSVGGDFQILRNSALTSLSGLGSLESVDGSFSIGEYQCDYTDVWVCEGFGNPALTSLAGLENLATVGGAFWLADNDALTTAGMSFDHLVSVGGAELSEGLAIDGHAALTTLPAFPQLTSVGWLEVWGNPSLTSLDGLDGLTSIADTVSIYDNTSLASLHGLDNVTTVGGVLGVYGDKSGDSLTSLAGLDSLTTVGAYLEVWDNSALTSLDGLDALTAVGQYVNLINNDALTSLSGLGGLTTVGLDFNVMDNDGLTTLDGVEALTDIGRNLQIMGYQEATANDQLTDVTALYGLLAVHQDVTITGNPMLTNAAAQGLVEEIEFIGGTVTISGNE